MIKIIKNGEVYAPNYLGKKDILIAGDKIGFIKENITVPRKFVDIDIIDASGNYIVPGFIDSHVHITGGGGEGSFRTRTPEIQLTDITKGGVTTVIGVLGTDGTTRSMENLIAKARGLEEEGITTYVYTGSYQVPVRTLTGSIQDDIILIDKIIGVGEVAMSDHRSSQPTVEDFAKLASEARVGGILSGKAGVVNIHVGDGERKIDFIENIVENTEIPITQFLPTHMNRNQSLFQRSISYAKKGGIVDFTTSTNKKFLEEGEVKCSNALRILLEHGVKSNNITFSSDGQGSLPDFDEHGRFIGIGIGKVTSLYSEVRDAIINENVPIDKALSVITANPADILKLPMKGYIQKGRDADIVLLNKENLKIESVIAKGKIMISEGKPIIKGTFE
ncbi:beta-aspartyl-peptidase [Anaerosalibacter massiliensis]|uniref:Isoaspartyl dipeptidase n=1 Tax=Anaerosalibacter massiliensis TaxID=1347392 RepID=A0A9X2MF73_9FIRM|nr:beta-aspartyl-peptidase [Anaerosalibacter massiliensis]MCR2043867.1 beta-aspartyl-peptidase [Anaerosalibacter massiliensis]